MKLWRLWKQNHCPKCGQKFVPIIYGFPGEELIEEAQHGEVILGGCVVQPEKKACPKCYNGGWGKQTLASFFRPTVTNERRT